MADLQCVICDFTVSAASTEDEVLSMLGTASPAAGERLIEHMSDHDLADWVRAFKMADAYIDKLEAKITELESTQFKTNAIALPTEYRGPVPQAGFQAPPAFADPGAAQRAEVRRRIEEHNHDETLIPRIPDAQRPEGVVGVKY